MGATRVRALCAALRSEPSGAADPLVDPAGAGARLARVAVALPGSAAIGADVLSNQGVARLSVVARSLARRSQRVPFVVSATVTSVAQHNVAPQEATEASARSVHAYGSCSRRCRVTARSVGRRQCTQ